MRKALYDRRVSGNDRREMRPGVLLALAGALYFAEGLPYGLVSELMPLYLRSMGVSLTEIGLVSVASLAWTLKFFWSPLVDRWGSYRGWIRGALTVLTLVLALFAASRATTGSFFWILLATLALASATQDIAIDAMTIAITPRRMLGPINSMRVTTYRIAFIVAGGGIAAIASWIGWSGAFSVCAAVMGALLLMSFVLPVERRSETERVDVVSGLRRWLNRPGAGWLLGLVLLYRLGDAALVPMSKPFWIDSGFTPAEIGLVTSGLGMAFTIAGAWIGGWVLSRAGLWRSLVWLGIIQMLSNGGYALLATFGGERPGFYAAAIVESFTGGLGTAAFLAFLMAICDKRFAATEYALLSALFALTRTVSGAASGWITDATGYAFFFWLTLLLGVPGLLLLTRMRGLLGEAPVTSRS